MIHSLTNSMNTQMNAVQLITECLNNCNSNERERFNVILIVLIFIAQFFIENVSQISSINI